jgi:hypothetical protein
MFLAGCVVSCGVLLILAGLSKVYRGARRLDGSSAIWRALRIPRRLVAPANVAFGSLECVVGVLVAARVDPAASGLAMAVLGGAFLAVLAYVRINRIPGDCGCIGLRKQADALARTVTWRALARAGLLAAAGVAAVFVGPAGTFVGTAGTGVPFLAGLLAGGAVLALLSAAPPRTPVCRRMLWRPSRASFRALQAHEVFAAMSSAAGPFGADVTYRRAGCADEFLFPAGERTVVFQVSRAASGGSLVVHATIAPAAAS